MFSKSFTHKPLPDPLIAAEKTPQNAAAAQNSPKRCRDRNQPKSSLLGSAQVGPLAPVRTNRG